MTAAAAPPTDRLADGATRVLRVAASAASLVWTLFVGGLLVGLVAFTLFGWRIDVIESGSMAPTVPVGSASFVSPVDAGDVAGLGVGDVIVFEHATASKPVLHRIVEVVETDGGSRRFRTKGDGNATADAALVDEAQVRGQLRLSVPGLGRLMLLLRPPWGAVVLVGVPLVAWALGALRRDVARRAATEPDATRTVVAGTSRCRP